MKHIKLSFWGYLAALAVLWLLADLRLEMPSGFGSWRNALINFTGIMGMGVMSVALMLAARPLVLEPFLGGLDKMYRLHKWLSISGLVWVMLHWLCKQSPGWLTNLGYLERHAREHAPEPANPIFKFLQSQRGLAEGVGEWAFYATVLLMVLALVKWFPYHLFFKTHRWLAVAYLFLVVHAVVLMKFSYWGQLMGPVMALLMLGGSLAAVVILLRRVGLSRRVLGVVTQVHAHKSVRVLEVGVQLQGRWSGHQSGQFVFVRFDNVEGAHPFTISSAWTGDGHMVFLIKGLGDYTTLLPDRLKLGDPVHIEGPYGQFNFDSDCERQIWVGGGIGITPFVARLEELVLAPQAKPIDLFYATALPYHLAIHKLKLLAREARVTLHVLVEAHDGRLTAQSICALVPDWRLGDIWFCGPARFGQALKADFATRGLPRKSFHDELFDLR
ncbi:ferric reductase-like transmembrane domain-containing protein [Rhodoferax sp. BLA1]|uniref:ferredoxin reductase family protein n=1 Tax=Rhodoferax sp. BLA1 TaxID=2576062 RepID=UPI0015D30B83